MVQWISFFYFLQYLHQIFKNLLKQGQFWYLLVLSFSKLSLLLIFGQVKAEKIELKDTRGHFHFSHFQVIFGLYLVTLWVFSVKNIFKINIFSVFCLLKHGSFVWKISEKVMQYVKLRFWKSRRANSTAKAIQIHVKNKNEPWCLLPQFSQL